MKIKKFFITGLTALIITLFTSQLFAIGLGAYGTLSKGKIEYTVTDEYEDEEFDDNYDASKIGIGFLLDTCVAYDQLFNYRLHIGYAKVQMDNTGYNYSINGNEFHLYNSFGFGVFRSQIMRFWLGPQIGLGFINGKYDFSGGDPDPNSFWSFFGTFGVILGINFNIGDMFTIGLDGGYRFESHAGTSEAGEDPYGEAYTYSFTGDGSEAFADICFIFRINDIF